MNPQKVAEDKCREIYTEAKGFFAGIERSRDYGFKILNSPPIYQTPILFIGYQPGGGIKDFEYETKLESHLTWPLRSEFANASWRLAKHMRDMFAPAINLEECVGLNAIFLRCPTISEHNRNLTSEDHVRVREFCVARVYRIIDALKPRKIATIGFSTLNLFGPTLSGVTNAKGRALTRNGKIGERDAIAMLHLSGARISNEDRACIAATVLADVQRSGA